MFIVCCWLLLLFAVVGAVGAVGNCVLFVAWCGLLLVAALRGCCVVLVVCCVPCAGCRVVCCLLSDYSNVLAVVC